MGAECGSEDRVSCHVGRYSTPEALSTAEDRPQGPARLPSWPGAARTVTPAALQPGHRGQLRCRTCHRLGTPRAVGLWARRGCPLAVAGLTLCRTRDRAPLCAPACSDRAVGTAAWGPGCGGTAGAGREHTEGRGHVEQRHSLPSAWLLCPYGPGARQFAELDRISAERSLRTSPPATPNPPPQALG